MELIKNNQKKSSKIQTSVQDPLLKNSVQHSFEGTQVKVIPQKKQQSSQFEQKQKQSQKQQIIQEINQSAHALPNQNQEPQNVQLVQETKIDLNIINSVQANPVQQNNVSSHQHFKLSSSNVQPQADIDFQQFQVRQELQENYVCEEKDQSEHLKPKILLQERIDSQEEPLIKSIKGTTKDKLNKQKNCRKPSKSIKKQEFMTREETLKLIKQQIKKALLLNKDKQKSLSKQEQPKIMENKQEDGLENCSNCHKNLQVPYYLNSYKNVKICSKCEKKNKETFPLIKIRQHSQANVILAVPSVVYDTDFQSLNLSQIPMSKCYNAFLTHMTHEMKAEMKKLIQSSLAHETKQKKAKQKKADKPKKVSTTQIQDIQNS